MNCSMSSKLKDHSHLKSNQMMYIFLILFIFFKFILNLSFKKKALSSIDQMRAKLNKLKEEEIELRKGLGIFKIDHPFSKDIQNVEKDIEALEQVWKLTKDWDDNYGIWKLTIFKTLETKDMDDTAQVQFKKLVKFSKELRVLTNFI